MFVVLHPTLTITLMRLQWVTLVFSCYDDFIGFISVFCRIILKQLKCLICAEELLRLFGLFAVLVILSCDSLHTLR